MTHSIKQLQELSLDIFGIGNDYLIFLFKLTPNFTPTKE